MWRHHGHVVEDFLNFYYIVCDQCAWPFQFSAQAFSPQLRQVICKRRTIYTAQYLICAGYQLKGIGY